MNCIHFDFDFDSAKKNQENEYQKTELIKHKPPISLLSDHGLQII